MESYSKNFRNALCCYLNLFISLILFKLVQRIQDKPYINSLVFELVVLLNNIAPPKLLIITGYLQIMLSAGWNVSGSRSGGVCGGAVSPSSSPPCFTDPDAPLNLSKPKGSGGHSPPSTEPPSPSSASSMPPSVESSLGPLPASTAPKLLPANLVVPRAFLPYTAIPSRISNAGGILHFNLLINSFIKYT